MPLRRFVLPAVGAPVTPPAPAPVFPTIRVTQQPTLSQPAGTLNMVGVPATFEVIGGDPAKLSTINFLSRLDEDIYAFVGTSRALISTDDGDDFEFLSEAIYEVSPTEFIFLDTRTAPVAASVSQAPTGVAAGFQAPGPQITGTRGVGNVQTVNAGTLTGTTPRTLGYQWVSESGEEYEGATATTFVDQEQNRRLYCDVTVDNDFGPPTTVRVQAAAPIALPASATIPLTFYGYDSGETATFDRAAPSGLFLDGTPYVVSGGTPIGLTGFSTPGGVIAHVAGTSSSNSAPRTVTAAAHGAERSPGKANAGTTLATKQGSPGNNAFWGQQGYDASQLKASWIAYTAARDVDPGKTGVPISLTEDTVVKSKSFLTQADLDWDGRPTLDDILPITVLTGAPAPDSFRPGFAGASKAIPFVKGQLRLDLLKNLSVAGLANRPPAAAYVIGVLSAVRTWQHTYNVNNENILAHNGLQGQFGGGTEDVYAGGGLTSYNGSYMPVVAGAMAWLNTNAWSLAEKEAVCIRLVQFAIDIKARADEGGIWQTNGGHAQGYKMLLSFAKFILQTNFFNAALNYVQSVSRDNGTVGQSIWPEDNYFKIITEADRTAAAGTTYLTGPGDTRDVSIPTVMLGWPDCYGETERNPGTGNVLGNVKDYNGAAGLGKMMGYIHITMKTYCSFALACAFMPSMKSDFPLALFQYCDRYMQSLFAPGPSNVQLTGLGTYIGALPTNTVPLSIQNLWTAHRGTVGLWSSGVAQGDLTPPVISGPTAVTINENTTAVATYTASEPVTWSLSGSDAALFAITSGGVLTFLAGPNFEAPTDAGANNVYNVNVIATDAATPTGNTDTRAVAVTVADVNETTYVQRRYDTNAAFEATITVGGTATNLEFKIDVEIDSLSSAVRFFRSATAVDLHVDGAGAIVVQLWDSVGTQIYNAKSANGTMVVGVERQLHVSAVIASGALTVVTSLDGSAITMTPTVGPIIGNGALRPNRTGGEILSFGTALPNMKFSDYYFRMGTTVAPAAASAWWNGGVPVNPAGFPAPQILLGGALTAAQINAATNGGTGTFTVEQGGMTDAP